MERHEPTGICCRPIRAHSAADSIPTKPLCVGITSTSEIHDTVPLGLPILLLPYDAAATLDHFFP